MEIPSPLTTVSLGSVQISEPITALTNLLLAICCFVFYYKTRQKAGGWAWFFALMGLSTLMGSAVHGGRLLMSYQANLNLWMAMGMVSGLGAAAGQWGTFSLLLRGKLAFGMRIACLLQVSLFVVFFLVCQSYTTVKIQIALAMLPAMCLHLFLPTGNRRVGAGIAISALPALIHSLKLGFGPWFDHIDCAHAIFLLSFWITFRGILTQSPDASTPSTT